jgi:hypothetical protein
MKGEDDLYHKSLFVVMDFPKEEDQALLAA